MTYKTKNKYLIIGFLICLILAYKLAISKTLDIKENYKILEQDAIASKNIPNQLAVLKRKENYYDSLLTSYQIKGSSINNSILKTINRFAKQNGIRVVSFIEPHIISQNDLLIKTYQFTLEGDYNAMTHLIYQLEQNTKFGEIINLLFEKKKNYRTRQEYLQAKILLKSFG